MKIEINNVTYIYNPGNPFEKKALDQINLTIDTGEFVGLIGHTGSGKSTLVQHLNGLMKPLAGDVIIDGLNTKTKGVVQKELRQKVGLVFQYPEYQLFEETVYKDIAFGPKNLNLSEEEIRERVMDACGIVGLDFEEIKDRSPFELSGGQKRRVAIAGIIAMKPQLLVLDEPTAGLDPRGRDEILDKIKKLYERGDISIILVSHSMEDIARLVGRIVVMEKAQIFMDGKPREIFSQKDKLESIGLGIPQITEFLISFQEKGHSIKTDVLTVEEAKEIMITYLRGKANA